MAPQRCTSTERGRGVQLLYVLLCVMLQVLASEHRVSIQPADYSAATDPDANMSVKHLASARYHRNQALVSEIFSDSVVPDGRSVVTEQRMTILRKQVCGCAVAVGVCLILPYIYDCMQCILCCT